MGAKHLLMFFCECSSLGAPTESVPMSEILALRHMWPIHLPWEHTVLSLSQGGGNSYLTSPNSSGFRPFWAIGTQSRKGREHQAMLSYSKGSAELTEAEQPLVAISNDK